jgi:monoamine oxidase
MSKSTNSFASLYPATGPAGNVSPVSRRDALRLGALLISPVSAAWPAEPAARRKRVIVAGGGLAGLVCAYELHKRGHEVVVVEASNRTGGHVRTRREGLDDGLYADQGAEHFTKPGYDLCWNYFKELDLPILDYPHREKILRVVDGRMVTQEEAAAINREKLKTAAFNQREREYLKQHPNTTSLSGLYLDRYIDKITDEYQPFGVGLDDLDALSLTDLLKRDGASEATVQRLGSGNSALHSIWKMAILKRRGIGSDPTQLFRIKGGNQGLPDALAHRLGDRIRLNSPIKSIRHDDKGVSVLCSGPSGEETIKGDYLVCCMNAIVLRQLRVEPVWPEAKRYAIANIPYTVETRLIFQSATKFWKKDGYTGNMSFGSPVGDMWPMAEDVPTRRGLLIGTSPASMTTKIAEATFRKYYPGKSADIERTMALDWSRDPWAMACEARTYKPGELRKIWPAVIQPVGRVYFAGAYCDNNSWGMEAASRSAFRVARAIHEA